MIPRDWAPPCGNQCSQKFAAFTQIPYNISQFPSNYTEDLLTQLRLQDNVLKWVICYPEDSGDLSINRSVQGEYFVKKGVLLMETHGKNCNEICYKDPVLKDLQWSVYIDRSPGAASYSQECFHACVAGCGYKFDIPSDKVDQIHPNRPTKPPPVQKPKPSPPKVVGGPPLESSSTTENMPETSA